MVDLVAENPGAEIVEIELDWDEPRRPHPSVAPAGDRIRDWRGPRRPRGRRSFDPRWLIVAAAALFAIWMLSGGGDRPSAPAPSSQSRSTASATTIDPRTQPDPTLDLAAAIAGLTEADLVTAWLEVGVDPDEVDKYALLRPVEMVPGDFRFGYMGADGFPIVIDTGSGDLRSIRAEVPAAGDVGAAVLVTADGAIGFDPEHPDEVVRLSRGVELVRHRGGDLLGLVPTDAGVEYGPFVPGEANPRSLLPGSAEVDIVPGVGAYATASTGGTLEITATGLERVTPHQLVATNGTRWLEFRRLVGGNEMVVTGPEGLAGGEYVLDNDLLDFGRGPAISPDGDWIFLPKGRETDDFPALYEIETGRLLDFEQRVAGLEPIWAPDSSFVAMIDPGRDCIYLFLTSGNNGCISLARLQIPALGDSRLVIFGPSATDASAASADPRSSATSE